MAIRKQGVSVSLSKEQVAALDKIMARTKIARSTLISEGVDGVIRKYAKQLNIQIDHEKL